MSVLKTCVGATIVRIYKQRILFHSLNTSILAFSEINRICYLEWMEGKKRENKENKYAISIFPINFVSLKKKHLKQVEIFRRTRKINKSIPR